MKEFMEYLGIKVIGNHKNVASGVSTLCNCGLGAVNIMFKCVPTLLLW